jgi:hypothetical protein
LSLLFVPPQWHKNSSNVRRLIDSYLAIGQLQFLRHANLLLFLNFVVLNLQARLALEQQTEALSGQTMQVLLFAKAANTASTCNVTGN